MQAGVIERLLQYVSSEEAAGAADTSLRRNIMIGRCAPAEHVLLIYTYDQIGSCAPAEHVLLALQYYDR
jgi:hypothetical protein